VRGWIGDIELTGETYAAVGKVDEALRRMEMLGGANIYLENVPMASGGLQQDGSFMVLDVPPGNSRVIFQIPGVADSVMTLENVPPNADVLIPSLKVGGGKAMAIDAAKIQVRLPAKERKQTNIVMKVSGQSATAVEVPVSELGDRRDYPTPEGHKPVMVVQ
jgi:hypothetical protein